jgi:hypothetical protein
MCASASHPVSRLAVQDEDARMKTNPSANAAVVPMETADIRDRLTGLMSAVREKIDHVEEPRFLALLETSAEVLQGLQTAFDHYHQHEEKAWRMPETNADTAAGP